MVGSSSQLPTTANRVVIKSFSSDNETVLSSSRKLGGAEHLIDISENAFVGRALNFGVRVILKGAVKY